MSHDIEANKKLAVEFMDALSSGDSQRILALYTEDVTVWTAGALPISGLHGRDEVVALCEGLLGAFPDGLQFIVKSMTAEEDRVAVEAEGSGDACQRKCIRPALPLLDTHPRRQGV